MGVSHLAARAGAEVTISEPMGPVFTNCKALAQTVVLALP